jgi:hypothetical protein
VDHLDRLRADLPTFETTGGGAGWSVGAHQFSAFRSCAKQLDLPVEIVMRAASTGRLGELIQVRNGSGRHVEKRNLARLDILYRKREIAARQVPPWS